MSKTVDWTTTSFFKQELQTALLDPATEQKLAHAWRNEADEAALHRLVKTHLRLAVSMAVKYRGYGAPVGDLIQEAGVGLMKAAVRFDPDQGARFATYAAFWIRASIQEYVMRDFSLVRIGSTVSQKRLFFAMRRVRADLEREHGMDLSGDEMRRAIADTLGCSLQDVEMMEGRLSGSDYSLNAQLGGDEGREWIDGLEDIAPHAEETVSRSLDTITARMWLIDAFSVLTPRERMIIIQRTLSDAPKSLKCLGDELKLSHERVRQIEVQALRKMKKRLVMKFGTTASDLATAL